MRFHKEKYGKRSTTCEPVEEARREETESSLFGYANTRVTSGILCNISKKQVCIKTLTKCYERKVEFERNLSKYLANLE